MEQGKDGMKVVLNRQHPQKHGKFQIGDIVSNEGEPECLFEIKAWYYCSWQCSYSRRNGCGRAQNVMRLKPVDPRHSQKFIGYRGTMCFCVGHDNFKWKVVRKKHEKKFQRWKQEVV